MERDISSKPIAQDLSAAGQLKLLEMAYARLRFSFTRTPFFAFPLVWFYSRQHDALILFMVACAYTLSVILTQWLYTGKYLKDRANYSTSQITEKWKPIIENLALLQGFGLLTSVLLTAPDSSFEFSIILHLILAASAAVNSTQQAAVFSVFKRFFFASWGLNVVLIYWVFPNQWQLFLPLSIFYGWGVFRHAVLAHEFFVKQVIQDEQNSALAEEYKLAKEQAEDALLEKNYFLTTASHDLRQPVHAVSMLIEAIASRNHDEVLKPLISDLKSSIRSINLMLSSLLDLSRFEAGKADIVQIPIYLDALINDVTTLFKEEARTQQLQLRVYNSRRKVPAIVLADPNLLRQALVNLVHNALRYTDEGGVLVSARRRDGGWMLEVWDTGIGVADGEHEQIYSPYYRNEHAWRVDSTGYGLGLHVVARCAKLMGASYGVSSRLRRGSRFWLKLNPANEAQALQTKAEHLSPSNTMSSALPTLHGRCLILEDDPQVISAWTALMRVWNVEAQFATCAREAFAALDGGFNPQAILCDQRLRSGESGYDILRDLLERLPQARGAMLSGEFASAELLEAENEGYLVLQKPLDAVQVHAVLSRWFKLEDIPQALDVATLN